MRWQHQGVGNAAKAVSNHRWYRDRVLDHSCNRRADSAGVGSGGSGGGADDLGTPTFWLFARRGGWALVDYEERSGQPSI